MTSAEITVRVLLAIGVVLVTVRGVGWLVMRIGQPRVIGELIAGILLGPSLLGLVLPGPADYLFGEQVIGPLRAVAQLGLVLFMVLVGLEVAPVRDGLGASRISVLAIASVAGPMLLASLMAAAIYPAIGGDVDRGAFIVFVGAALSVTALPVLARILEETGLAGSRLGIMSLVCAAANDVAAWIMVGLAATLATASGPGGFAATAVGAVALVLVLLLAVRPVLTRLGPPPLWSVVVIALACAWLGEQIGVHAIFGAFVAGAAMPRSPAWRSQIRERLAPAVTAVLLPVFFVVVGLSTRVDQLDGLSLTLLGVVVAVAVLSKVGSVSVAARLVGERWPDALTMGVLMNARGVTEVVVLTIGLDLGVINSTLFTVLVLMAVVTTFMAAPLLQLVRAWSRPDELART